MNVDKLCLEIRELLDNLDDKLSKQTRATKNNESNEIIYNESKTLKHLI